MTPPVNQSERQPALQIAYRATESATDRVQRVRYRPRSPSRATGMTTLPLD